MIAPGQAASAAPAPAKRPEDMAAGAAPRPAIDPDTAPPVSITRHLSGVRKRPASGSGRRRSACWACRTEIGRAHVGTPVTNAHLVCRLLLDKKKIKCQTLN